MDSLHRRLACTQLGDPDKCPTFGIVALALTFLDIRYFNETFQMEGKVPSAV